MQPSQGANLGSFIDGFRWTVTYYRQLLGADNAAQAHDVNKKPAFQQYEKIENLELMVTQPLAPGGQDGESGTFNITGTAVQYGFLIPNEYDMFVANVDNGQSAIFTLTSAEKASYLKTSNYQIQYKLVAYTDPTLVADLDNKSVAVFQFSRELLEQGQNPLLTSSAFALRGGFEQLFTDLASMYFRDFFSVERQTLLVPDQNFETYDHFLTKALVDIVGTDESLVLPRIRMPAVEGDQAMTNVTVWDALMQANRSLLITGIQRMGITPTVVFRNFPYLTGIYYSGINQIVYPYDARTDVDVKYGYASGAPVTGYTNDGTPRYRELERLFREKDELFFKVCCKCVEDPGRPDAGLPVIVPVTQDDYYVFTGALYGVRNTAMASQLEVLVRQAINNQAFNKDTLANIAAQAFGWPNLERYYYIPALLALMRIALRSN